MTTSEQPLDLGSGAAAVLDVLGFKAARKVHGAAKLVSSVRRYRDGVRRTAEMEAKFGRGEVTTATISDTVIMARQAAEKDADGNVVTLGATVRQLVLAASQLVTIASAGSPALAFRGCIAAGELVATPDHIFVGQAIDEAAELAEQALGAMVWLTPAASSALAVEEKTPLTLEWPVRLHDRGEVTAFVVNPFWLSAALAGSAESAAETLRATLSLLMQPFGVSHAIDVVQKQQNTARFLEYAENVTVSRWGEIRESAGLGG